MAQSHLIHCYSSELGLTLNPNSGGGDGAAAPGQGRGLTLGTSRLRTLQGYFDHIGVPR